ncbi:MAG: Ig-like domain-containing protein, partial [Defluviitaleaceae bacterium]|nr:Ig-like domain-containing protein [Defluviitaleaceae bacterium]
MKKTTAIFLAAILLLSACASGVPFIPPPDVDNVPAASRSFDTRPLTNVQPLTAVGSVVNTANNPAAGNAINARDGYTLTPTMQGATGIDTLSAFVFTTPYATPAGALPALSIDGQPPLNIARESATSFLAAPAMPLSSNAVYVFRLGRDGSADLTWAFQTTVRFEITSTLPRNQATNVPVSTGIEFNFSIPGETNIADYFSIYPHVDGRFIDRDNTAVFMPTRPLNHLQIYTVTIAPGTALQGTSEVITTPHTFSFETVPAPTAVQPNWTARIHFNERYVEFPTFAAPSVHFRFNYNRDARRPVINMGVYRIDDRAQAIAATNRLANTPRWSSSAETARFVDTSGLTQVYSARISNRGESRWQETFAMSTTLPPGFYVLHAATTDSSSQMIIQITDLAVQVVADNHRALVWVNDMNTGRPIDGAKVYDPIDGETYETSEYGIAVVERRLATGEYLLIAADDSESVVFMHAAAFQSFDRWGGWSEP